MINFISDYGFDWSMSWHYSVNAAKHQQKLLEVGSFKRWPKRVSVFEIWEGRGCARAAKDDNGLKYLVVWKKNGNYILLVFYYCPDKYFSLLVMLSLGRWRVFVYITYINPARGITSTIAIAIRPSPRIQCIIRRCQN